MAYKPPTAIENMENYLKSQIAAAETERAAIEARLETLRIALSACEQYLMVEKNRESN